MGASATGVSSEGSVVGEIVELVGALAGEPAGEPAGPLAPIKQNEIWWIIGILNCDKIGG